MFVVSWSMKDIHGYRISGQEGNKSFASLPEMEQYIADNKYCWFSYCEFLLSRYYYRAHEIG